MSKVLAVLVLALTGSVVGCAADDRTDSASGDSALEGSAVQGFRAVTGCQKNDYVGEVDFTDRQHPRYRIRHSDASRGAEVGKQNIGLVLALGKTLPRRAWLSPDTLVSVHADMDTPELREASDRAVPWRELPVTDDFLALAFDGEGVHLESAEFIFNVPYRVDPFCRASFADK